MTFKFIQYQCDLCKTLFKGNKHEGERIITLNRFFGRYSGRASIYGAKSGYTVENICPDCEARLSEAEGALAEKIQKETKKQRRSIVGKMKREIKRRIKEAEKEY